MQEFYISDQSPNPSLTRLAVHPLVAKNGLLAVAIGPGLYHTTYRAYSTKLALCRLGEGRGRVGSVCGYLTETNICLVYCEILYSM
jgi:hypothetical protein